MALRRTDWAIRHHPEDVPRQLDRAERLLDRYGAWLALTPSCLAMPAAPAGRGV